MAHIGKDRASRDFGCRRWLVIVGRVCCRACTVKSGGYFLLRMMMLKG